VVHSHSSLNTDCSHAYTVTVTLATIGAGAADSREYS
jgi:hypothetical protein